MLSRALEHASAESVDASAVACDIWKCVDQVVRELVATTADLSGALMQVVGACYRLMGPTVCRNSFGDTCGK
eukprot:10635957-Alexandrium_andersonii.AAC.1